MEEMNKLNRLIARIAPLDESAMAASRAHWDAIAKPLSSLGTLETIVTQIAGIQGNADVRADRRAVVAMCADNGVVAEGVTQTGQEVTGIVSLNMARNASSVCAMARVAGAEVVPVNIGIAGEVSHAHLLDRRLMKGTHNMVHGPAMPREIAIRAILTGAEVAASLADQGYRLLLTGEMGIGNTTTSSAIASVLLRRPIREMTGRGAGLSDEGLRRKVDAIERAIALNRPDEADPLDVLHKVGGLDIAGLVGVYLGGAACRLPVVIDGFISSVAALVAARLCPTARNYMLASHVSKEPAGALLLDALGMEAVVHAGMSLGEGTGAVTLLPLIDMALSVYHQNNTFAHSNIEAYHRFDAEQR